MISQSDKEGTTREAIDFCEALEECNYFVGIYASRISGFKDRLNAELLDVYTWWVADYSNPVPAPMQQYSSKGIIPGIDAYADLNVCTIDFPELMKANHLNGY